MIIGSSKDIGVPETVIAEPGDRVCPAISNEEPGFAVYVDPANDRILGTRVEIGAETAGVSVRSCVLLFTIKAVASGARESFVPDNVIGEPPAIRALLPNASPLAMPDVNVCPPTAIVEATGANAFVTSLMTALDPCRCIGIMILETVIAGKLGAMIDAPAGLAVILLEPRFRILTRVGSGRVLLPMMTLESPGRSAMGVFEMVVVLLGRRVELEMIRAGKTVGWWVRDATVMSSRDCGLFGMLDTAEGWGFLSAFIGRTSGVAVIVGACDT